MGQRCTLAADLYSFGLLLVELTTQQLVTRRGKWRWPRVPHECPQARAAQRSAGRLRCAPPSIPCGPFVSKVCLQPACSLDAR